MISCSDAWKKLYTNITNELLPESDIRIMCSDNIETDLANSNFTTSKKMANFNEIGNTFVGNNAYSMNTVNKKTATCEWNSFVLDGSFDLWTSQSDTEKEFVSSDISDENCVFQNEPYIKVDFTGVVSTKTWRTIRFSPIRSEFATSMSIKTTYYQGSTSSGVTTITEKTVERQSDLSNYEDGYVLRYDGHPANTDLKETYLYIKKWNKPFRRARIEEFKVGQRFVFNKTNIMDSVEYSKNVDMVNGELPQNDISFSIYDPNNDYDRWNTDARFAYAFDNDTRFVVNCGFLINGAWEYHQTESLLFKGLTRDNNSLSAKITLENPISRLKQYIPKFKITTDYADWWNNTKRPPNYWNNYGKFVSVLNSLTGVSISIDSSVTNNSKDNDSRDDLCYPYTGMALQYYTRTGYPNIFHPTQIVRMWDKYFKTKISELLQMAAQILTSYIHITTYGNIVLKSKTDSTGNIKAKSNYTSVDTIKLDEMYKLPEITSLKEIKKVTVDTLEYSSNDGNTGDNGANPFEELYAVSSQTFNFASSGTSEKIENNLLYYKDKKADSEKATCFFQTSTGIQPAKYIAQFVNDFTSKAMKISVETIINPLWELGDCINIETKNGSSTKTYKGFLTSIKMSYAGTFKGTIEVLVPKSYR